uniref:Protein kinase domain-containing protein n=1 Tax=Naja naja TaxID=35670 RepID=A0A8C6VDJ1_NAJNA
MKKVIYATCHTTVAASSWSHDQDLDTWQLTHIYDSCSVPRSCERIDKKIVRTEIGVLLRLSHPNIIKLKDIFETPTEITLILELVTGGELFDRIVERGFYSERDAAHVVKQILEAVSVSHLNVSFLFLDSVSLHLFWRVEFWLPRKRKYKFSPEILHGSPYGPEVDMWSVGVITYILLCGFEPFFDPRGDQYMYSRILNCDYEFVSPWWDEVSLNAKDLVQKLIVLDPQKRLTVHQALEHPWVTGKAAKFAHMDSTQKKLQEFNARRKLKVRFWRFCALVWGHTWGLGTRGPGSVAEAHNQVPVPVR